MGGVALTDNRSAPMFDRTRRSAQTEVLDDPISTANLAPIMQGHRPVLR